MRCAGHTVNQSTLQAIAVFLILGLACINTSIIFRKVTTRIQHVTSGIHTDALSSRSAKTSTLPSSSTGVKTYFHRRSTANQSCCSCKSNRTVTTCDQCKRPVSVLSSVCAVRNFTAYSQGLTFRQYFCTG